MDTHTNTENIPLELGTDQRILHIMSGQSRVGLLKLSIVEGRMSLIFDAETGYSFSTEVPVASVPPKQVGV